VRHQIILDLSRLVYAAWSPNPTGIPRVELAYAQHLLARDPDNLQFAVMDAIGRLRLADRRRAIAFVNAIAWFWQSGVASRSAHWWLMWRALNLHGGLLTRGAGTLRRQIAGFPGATIYVIVSQLHLERRQLIERLKRRGDIRLVYFVHDVIPAQYPEYFVPKDSRRNRARMSNAADLADAIITNSEATRQAFIAMFGRKDIATRTHVALLGVSRPVLPANAQPPTAQAYFVCLATIEPRKNHLLLLNIWRRIIGRLGTEAPRLVLIGGRGWENENVVDMLDRSTTLRRFVEERNYVSDNELAQLLGSSCALLFPSFAEGYGLPLAEALAAGVPALCSDIPAFHEVGGDVPEFLDPIDGPAWEAAIIDYAAVASPRRDAQLMRLKHWQIPSREEHFVIIDQILASLVHGASGHIPDTTVPDAPPRSDLA
jgi:glycosyltransferase involved in cell wall biosynthesis